jgi:hypothetical protein
LEYVIFLAQQKEFNPQTIASTIRCES